MSKVSSDLLNEAFIKPIRFALLLDDRFPTFQTLASEAFDSSLDNARARDLFAMCRDRGWLCDVSNKPIVAEKFENDNHLHQSDLLILDYNLDPGDQNDPTAAIRIIQSLAGSDHFNLAIVYTDSDPRAVTREIAYCLGAGEELGADRAKAADSQIENLDPDDAEKLSESFSQTLTDEYLKGLSLNKSGAEFRKELVAVGIDRKLQSDALIQWVRRRLTMKIKAEILANRRPDRPVSTSLRPHDTSFWVTQDNVFVAVVNKKDSEPKDLITRLEEAISDWDPNPLLVMMMHARSALEKAGTLADQKVLETPRLRAGWLLRVLLGKTDAARRTSISELYGRLFDRLATSIEPSIVEFGAKLVRPSGDHEPVDLARSLAGEVGDMRASTIYHALNEHLCADACPDGVMTTGVILKARRGMKDSYWVCVTPACDLIDGQNEGGWDGDLLPTRAVSVARLEVIKSPGSVTKVLENSTVGRHLFLFVDNAPVALEVIEAKSRQMSLETLFLRDRAMITNGRTSGYTVGVGNDGTPTIMELEFEALAKLRPNYANRLLTQAGSQRARIGVNFVNLPAPPAECEQELESDTSIWPFWPLAPGA